MSINLDVMQRVMHKVRQLNEEQREDTIRELLRRLEEQAKPHITERIKKKAAEEGEV